MIRVGDDVLIRARGLCLERGGRNLLEGIDLDLRRGEHWLIWGPSGAGKTSLARLLAGLATPTSGELSFATPPPHPMLFQDPDAQLAAATVESEIALGAHRPGDAPEAARDRVRDSLGRFRLESFASRNPHSLSGGEKRRLGLAALMVMDRDLLILDEPELHLDEPSWDEFLRSLDAWRARSPRLLLEISRDPARAESADGIILIREGRLVAEGSPREVYESHRAPDLPRVEAFESGSLPPANQATGVPGDPLIEALGLGLGLPGGGVLFEDLRISLRRGERVLLSGDNGSGKSTLLLILAGLADADRGEVRRVEGLETALALQDPERTFFAETVGDEIAFAPSRRGLTGEELEQRVREAMAALGLPADLRQRDPISLSAGEMRRLALASLFALDPDFLFLDEPVAGLDPANARLFAESLFGSGRGFLWADCRVPRDLEASFDRRYTLREGKLAEVHS